MIGQSVGSDASPLSCFLFRPRKRLEKCRKRSHIDASNASVIWASRVSQTPLQAPFPTSINGYHTAKKLLSQSPAKRPTFAFADESGYTLAFIAHSGLHGETRGVSDGGAITTLGAFHTFRKPCVARCQNGILCPFWVLAEGAPEERRKPAEQRCAYARRCSAGVAAPPGCVIFFASVEIGICTSGAHGFLRVRDTGGITTLGVLCMLPKCRTAACQSGLFVVFLRPLFTFAKAPAGHCQYPHRYRSPAAGSPADTLPALG